MSRTVTGDNLISRTVAADFLSGRTIYGETFSFVPDGPVDLADIVAYYPFDGDSPNDLSGNGRHLTAGASVAYVAGKFNRAVDMPGASNDSNYLLEYTTVAPFLPGTGDFTLTGWVKVSGYGAGNIGFLACLQYSLAKCYALRNLLVNHLDSILMIYAS